jgi:hypothetical protein
LVLTAAHGIAYQMVEKRHLPWVLIFTALLIAVAAIQIIGFLRFQGHLNRRQGG